MIRELDPSGNEIVDLSDFMSLVLDAGDLAATTYSCVLSGGATVQKSKMRDHL